MKMSLARCRWVRVLALGFFLTSWTGAAIHGLHEAEDAGEPCAHGLSFECSGCDSSDHHHHGSTHSHAGLCRTCSDASLTAPTLEEGVSTAPDSTLLESSEAAGALREVDLRPPPARGPPRV